MTAGGLVYDEGGGASRWSALVRVGNGDRDRDGLVAVLETRMWMRTGSSSCPGR